MVNNEKVGIGIITCNRKDSFASLFNAICSANDIDDVVIVKNLEYDYLENDPQKLIDNAKSEYLKDFHYVHETKKLGIAHNKNLAARHLLENGCEHIFIVEDDIKLKDVSVFRKYVETAKEFKLEHLNFGRSFDTMILHDWLKPVATIGGKSHKLDIFNRLSGDFSYFTANALRIAGLYNEKYINALDHCEHTYRMSLLGFYTPFYAFADIENSTDYIEDTGTHTTIQHDSQHEVDVQNAFKLFVQTYGKTLKDVKYPTQEELVNFLRNKQVV